MIQKDLSGLNRIQTEVNRTKYSERVFSRERTFDWPCNVMCGLYREVERRERDSNCVTDHINWTLITDLIWKRPIL